MYVIQRTDGQYVARRGSEHSYTRHLENAQVWESSDQARRERCPDNERVVQLETIFGK